MSWMTVMVRFDTVATILSERIREAYTRSHCIVIPTATDRGNGEGCSLLLVLD